MFSELYIYITYFCQPRSIEDEANFSSGNNRQRIVTIRNLYNELLRKFQRGVKRTTTPTQGAYFRGRQLLERQVLGKNKIIHLFLLAKLPTNLC